MEKSIKQTIIEILYKTKEDYKKFSNILTTLKTPNPNRVEKLKLGAIFAKVNYLSLRMNVLGDILSEVFQENLNEHFTVQEMEERKFMYEVIDSYNDETGAVNLPKGMEEAIEKIEQAKKVNG